MPKRQKTSLNSYEGRPPQLTLGDFMFNIKPLKKGSSPNNEGALEGAVQAEKSENSTFMVNFDINSKNIQNNLPLQDEVSEIDENTVNKDKNKFFVCQTKKGGIPIEIQNRASGKKVTVIENVHGDVNSLLIELKSKFGTGGLWRGGDVIELQGDFKDKLISYLNSHKHMRPYGCKKF